MKYFPVGLDNRQSSDILGEMAKTTVKLASKQPDWLIKIAKERELEIKAAFDRAFLGRLHLAIAKLDVEVEIDDINSKFGTKFTLADLLTITPEDEQQATQVLEDEDDED